MKKKLLALVCALALTVSLVGCALSTPDTVGKIGDFEVTSGLYLLAQYDAYHNCTYFFCNRSNHRLNSRFVCHVAYVTVSFDTFCSISSHTFVYQLLIDVVKTNFSTLFCKCRSNSKSDTIRSTCNESYFTFQRKIQKLIHNSFCY